MRPASWPMSPPRIYHGPTAPILLLMLADMERIVDYAIDGGIVPAEVWAEFARTNNIDLDALRDVVETELAEHGMYG